MENSMTEGNGLYKVIEKRFNDVDKELLDLKDDLAKAIRELAASITNQAEATKSLEETVSKLSTQFSSFLQVASNAIPLKAVGWMFAIILVFVLVLITGIEGLKHLPKLMGVF